MLLAFPMLQLLKIVFTFGKEFVDCSLREFNFQCQSGSFKLTKRSRAYKPSALRVAFLQPILCPKNERQQGKRRVFRIQNEILDRKHLEKTRAFFSPNSRALAFLVETDNNELIQVTKITRSNRDKSPYNVHTKEISKVSANVQLDNILWCPLGLSAVN